MIRKLAADLWHLVEVPALILALMGIGFALGKIPAPKPIEAAAPQTVLTPQARVMERNPTAPRRKVPTGAPGVLVRQIHAEVEPEGPGPLGIDVHVLEQKDGTARAVVEAEGGRVVGGWDLPIQAPPRIPDTRPWCIGAGASLGPDGRAAPVLMAGWSRGRVQIMASAGPVWAGGQLRPVVMVAAGWRF